MEKEMVQKLDGVELRSGYYVPQGQPNSNMIQLDHPSDVCAPVAIVCTFAPRFEALAASSLASGYVVASAI